jgi:hypothetical protein
MSQPRSSAAGGAAASLTLAQGNKRAGSECGGQAGHNRVIPVDHLGASYVQAGRRQCRILQVCVGDQRTEIGDLRACGMAQAMERVAVLPACQWIGIGEAPRHAAHAPSIAEFCRAHGVSRAFVYALLKRGEGPTIMKAGRRTLVSVEAAAEWRRRMEALASAKLNRGGQQP